MAFLFLTPLTDGNISMSWMGARGLFVAMICGLIVPTIYKNVTKVFVIKLPDSVPQFIADSFKGITPAFVVAVGCFVLNLILEKAGLVSLHNLIYTLIGAPLRALSSNVWSFALLQVGMQFLWFFGIHGGSALGGISMIMFAEPTLENISAAGAGLPLPNIVTNGLGMIVGNQGVYVACCIALIFFTKREDFKAIGRLGLVPGAFGISEPLRFGLPFVLNPTLFIPQVFVHVVNIFITYICVITGLVGRPRTDMFNAPIFAGSFLAGGIPAVLLCAVCLVIDFFIWLY